MHKKISGFALWLSKAVKVSLTGGIKQSWSTASMRISCGTAKGGGFSVIFAKKHGKRFLTFEIGYGNIPK